jgi:predicted RND superfamily exporter protein
MLKFSSQAFHNNNPEAYAMPSSDEFVALSSYLRAQKGSKQNLKSLIDSTFQSARVSVQMADIGSVETGKLRDEVKARIDSIFPPEDYIVKVTGTSLIVLKGNEYLIDNLTQSMVWALILNSILMAFLFLSWKMILISLIPNIIPLIITLGIMGYGGIYLKPSTIIIFSITYGIAIDFTIHFLAKYRHFLKKHNWNMGIAVGDALKESGVSIVYTSLVLFCGFIIFAFSSFGGTVALGIFTSVSLFIGMFTNIFLLPAMLLSLEKLVNARQELGRAIVDLEGD